MVLRGRRVALIGAGNIAEALIRGLLNVKVVEASQIIASDPREDHLQYLHERYAIEVTTDNVAATSKSDVVLLCFKPQILDRVMSQIGPHVLPETLVITILAGVPIAGIERFLDGRGHVCRAMPNTPVLVGEGATGIAVGDTATAEHTAQTRAIFEAVGTVTLVDEVLMDAVTGLSGSGPAYVFMIIEALADAGVKVGLPRRQAQAMAAQTVLGSAKLLIETGEHPGVLKDMVTSPGGTAIDGLATLEEGGLRTTLINGVVAATERSRSLGEQTLKKTWAAKIP